MKNECCVEEEGGGVRWVGRVGVVSGEESPFPTSLHLHGMGKGLPLLLVSPSTVPASPAQGALGQAGSARGFSLGLSLSPRAQLFL